MNPHLNTRNAASTGGGVLHHFTPRQAKSTTNFPPGCLCLHGDATFAGLQQTTHRATTPPIWTQVIKDAADNPDIVEGMSQRGDLRGRQEVTSRLLQHGTPPRLCSNRLPSPPHKQMGRTHGLRTISYFEVPT